MFEEFLMLQHILCQMAGVRHFSRKMFQAGGLPIPNDIFTYTIS